MIRVLNSSYELQAILKLVINPKITEEINGEYTCQFSCVLDDKASTYINENNIIEVEDDYFDIIMFEKSQNSDGTLTVAVECEHISYRLNDTAYNTATFAELGAPSAILTAILTGTILTASTIDYTADETYSATEAKSRRALLMEFAEYLGGEVEFDKLNVSILTQRGTTTPKYLVKGKNIRVVSKRYNKREVDSSGNYLVSYKVQPIQTTSTPLALGDEVILVQDDLGISETLRIVKISYNPLDEMDIDIEIANFVSTLESQLYRIETSSVAKNKIYNGCSIGPDEGFVALRSDGKAKAIFNATEGISLYGDTGSGLTRNFYVDTSGIIQAREINISGTGTFGGSIVGGSIIIGTSPDVFAVDSSGNTWVGGSAFETAPFSVTKSGVATASDLTITGGDITLTADITVGGNIYIGSAAAKADKGVWFYDSGGAIGTNVGMFMYEYVPGSFELRIDNRDDYIVVKSDKGIFVTNTAETTGLYAQTIAGDEYFDLKMQDASGYDCFVRMNGTANLTLWNYGVGNVDIISASANITFSTPDGKTIAYNDFQIQGNTELYGTVDISGNMTVYADSFFSGDVTLTNSLFVGNSLHVSGDMTVYANANVSGALTVNGNSSVWGTLNASGDVTLGSNLYLGGNMDMSGTLTVYGTTYFSGNCTISHDLLIGDQIFTSAFRTYVDTAGAIYQQKYTTAGWTNHGLLSYELAGPWLGANFNGSQVFGTYYNASSVLTYNGNYYHMYTRSADTTCANNWNFTGTLNCSDTMQYNSREVCHSYYTGSGKRLALNFESAYGTYGALEIWLDDVFKGWINLDGS